MTNSNEMVPSSPLKEIVQALSSPGQFRTLFLSSFVIDLGLCLYFLLYSLFLAEHHFSEQSIGLITAALTIGTIVSSIPAGYLVRRVGMRPVMLTYVGSIPLLLALRLFFLSVPVQVGLAFLAGSAMSLWTVAFSPALSSITTRENRTFGFSLFMASGISSGIFAGMAGGHLPDYLSAHLPQLVFGDGIRSVLLLACGVIAVAFFGVVRLHLGTVQSHKSSSTFTPFLFRFLVVVAAWSFALNFFVPFASVYLTRVEHLPLSQIGTLYSVSQVVQVAAIALAPLLYRRIGLVRGIALAQIVTGCLLYTLSRMTSVHSAVIVFLVLNAVQWMNGPGIAALLMNGVEANTRSQAAAAQSFVSMTAQASSTLTAGRLFSRFGYYQPLRLDAGLAVLAGVCTGVLLGRDVVSAPSSAEQSIGG